MDFNVHNCSQQDRRDYFGRVKEDLKLRGYKNEYLRGLDAGEIKALLVECLKTKELIQIYRDALLQHETALATRVIDPLLAVLCKLHSHNRQVRLDTLPIIITHTGTGGKGSSTTLVGWNEQEHEVRSLRRLQATSCLLR